MVLHGVGMNPNLLRNPGEVIPGNIPTVYPHAFTEILNVRRRVKPGPISGGTQNRVQHGTGGALAVAAGNMDEFQLFLRVADGM